MEDVRVECLKAMITDILSDGRKTFEVYSKEYGHTHDGVRAWWRRFLYTFYKRGLWYKDVPIEPEWMGRTVDAVLKIAPDRNDATLSNTEEKWVEDLEKGLAVFEGLSDKPVRSEEEAMRIVGADPKKWEVYHYESTVWQVTSFKRKGLPLTVNNYRNHIKMRLRKDNIDDVLERMVDAVGKVRPRGVAKSEGTGIGVLNVSDFHLGADVSGLSRSLDFNMDILIEHLHKVADKVNRMSFHAVHVNMLGDFFESISGMNHPNTFKELGLRMYGANLFILADKIYSEHFLSRINNLAGINIIGGNHDRLASDKMTESTSEGAQILAYLLQKTLADVKVKYHHSILVDVIDGIQYILYHGDKNFAKADASKIILDYGDNQYYTCLIGGHKHTREVIKTAKTHVTTYKNIPIVEMDELKYRKYTIAPLFTGNLYSENLGYASTAGALVIWNNGNNKPDTWDMCLS